MGLLDFQTTYKNTICCSFKTLAWPLDDAKPMSNDLVDAMLWQCMFALSMSILWSLLFDVYTVTPHKEGRQAQP
jgi:hypothetical protein